MTKRKGNDNNSQQPKKTRSDETSTSVITTIEDYNKKLDELLEGNLDFQKLIQIKHIVKNKIAKEKNIKSGSFRHNSFKKITIKIIELNQMSKTNYEANQIITNLLDIVSIIDIESCLIEDLYNIFELFINQLIKDMYLNETVADFIAKIGKHLSNYSQQSSVKTNKLLEKIISESKYNQNYILCLLRFLIQMSSVNNKNIVEMIFNKIFDKKLNSENLSWSPEKLPLLVEHTLNLITIYSIENHEKIYKYLITIFMKIDTSKSISIKQVYFAIQKKAIISITNHLIDNKREHVNIEFVKSIQSFFENYKINPLMNHFFTSLIISLASCESNFIKNKVIEMFLKSLEIIAKVLVNKIETKWISSSSKQNFSLKDLNKMFKHNLLIKLIDSERLINAILSISIAIIETYGVEINQYKKEPITIEEHLNLFVSEMLEDLFMYSKEGREKVIVTLIEKCFESNKSNRVFLSQLEILLNSRCCLKIFIDSCNHAETHKVNSLIMSRLNGDYQSKLKSASSVSRSRSNNKIHISNLTTNRLNDITEMDKIEDSLRMLDAVSLFIFVNNKNPEFNNLINLLKLKMTSSQIINESHDLVKIKIKCLIKIIKCLNKNHLNAKDNDGLFFIHDYNQMRNKIVTENFQTSLSVLKYLISLLDNEAIESSTKSIIYQSFCHFIKSNANLSPYIIEFFLKKLDSLVILSTKTNNSNEYIERHGLSDYFQSSSNQDFLIYFDLAKCIIFKAESNAISCIEPIDIILNCADICARTSGNLIQTPIINAQSLTNLNRLIKAISTTYLKKDAKQMYEIYKNQLNKKKIAIDSSYLKLTHQIECGILDCLLEYLIQSEQYSDVTKVLERIESTENCLCLEIDSLLIEKQQLKHKSTSSKSLTINKRKIDSDSNEPVTKKSKSSLKQDINNENQDNDNEKKTIKKSKSVLTKREPFSDITSKINQQSNSDLLRTTSQPTSTHQQKQINTNEIPIEKNMSFFNIKLERTPRISYSFCMKLFELTLCSGENGNFKSSRILNDANSLLVLVSLITSQKLIDYSHNVIDKKLQALSDCTDEYYDPESFDSNELFDFLSKFWVSFFQRINAPNQNETSLFKPNITHKFSCSFFVKTQRYINYCQTIWSLVNQKFQKNRDALIKNEREHYEPNDDDLWCGYTNDNQSKKVKIYWKFLSFCKKTVKLHFSPPLNYYSIATKIVKSMLSLMHDILQSIELNESHYENLNEWLYELLNNNLVSEAEELSLLVIKMQNYVIKKISFNSTFLKYLSIDYYNHVYSSDENDEESNINDLDMLDYTQQFSLFKNENVIEHINFMLNEINILFDKFNWSLKNLKYFNKNKLTEFIIHQLENIAIIFSNLLKSCLDIQMSQLILKELATFYQFLRKFFKTDLLNIIDDDRMVLIKRLLDTISSKLQSSFQKEFRRIKDFINSNLDDENSTHEPTQSNINNECDIYKLFKFREYFMELIKSVEAFEEEIDILKNSNKEWSIMKNFTHSIKDLKFDFETKITKIISPDQLDEIIYRL